MPMRLLLPSCLLVTVLAAPAAPAAPTTIPDTAIEVAKGLIATALTDDTAVDFTRDLTTEVGPRLAGGPNDLRAREWSIERFRELGFDRVWTEPVTFPKWARRHESGAIVAPFPQPLVLTALGYSAGTPAGGLTAEVVSFESLEALTDADPVSLKGRIVYIGKLMGRFKDGRDYRYSSAIRTQGPPIAAAKGAAAFLLRSAGTDLHQRVAHSGVTAFRDPAKAIPAAALANPDADQLERILTYGKPVRVHLDLDVGFEGEYTGANVIGEVTGNVYPEQVIAIGGHLDSWDLGTGAIDDAAGVAIAAAAAHLIAELPERPDRSIRVIAFASEEMGLWGGRAYAAKHGNEVAKHVLGSESDFGAGSIWRMSASVKPEARWAIEQIAEVLEPLGVRYDADRPGRGGPDLSQMHAAGMAALSLTQDGTRYFDWHHSVNDTFDKIDPEALAQNVAVYAVVAWLAAQAEGDFGSAPGAFAQDDGGE